MNKAELAYYFDHTILKAETTSRDVDRVCQEAIDHHFYAVCVNPDWITRAVANLKGSHVKTCSVVGFPFGTNTSLVKAHEAALAVAQGADEVDMVLSIGKMKEGLIDEVEADIRTVVEAAQTAVVKVIIETCYLSEDEKINACRAAENAGAHFVKTSTGFGSGGATAADVRLMRQTVSDHVHVKASGGIATLADVLSMIEAGAHRIGTSAGANIIAELTS